jgi:predicted ArsR family transcriptional regulator
MPAKKRYTVAQAAERLGISTNAVRKAIKKGRLSAAKGKYTVERTIKRTLTGYLVSDKDLAKYQVSERHLAAGKKTD